MPDIPLKHIGRNTRSKTGYSQLQSGDVDRETDSSTANGLGNGSTAGDKMPASVRAAAVFKGKKVVRSSSYKYDDSTDEEDRLLGGHDGEDAYEEEREVRRRPEASGISRSVSNALIHCFQGLD